VTRKKLKPRGEHTHARDKEKTWKRKQGRNKGRRQRAEEWRGASKKETGNR
jgi:hypothetical protein